MKLNVFIKKMTNSTKKSTPTEKKLEKEITVTVPMDKFLKKFEGIIERFHGNKLISPKNYNELFEKILCFTNLFKI